LFGTIPTLVQVQHWGHHRRNRTESERGEFIHEDESPFGKTVRYYVAILGGLWLVCPLVALLVPFLPFSAARWLAADRRFNTYAAAFLDFDAASWQRMRLEGLLFWCVWGALLVWGPWSPATLAVAYGSFAFSWSTLQWIYHVNTPIHVVEGAYNLRLPTPLRWLFLNFNYNLTHHRHPYLSWQELPKHTDLVETQPMWYRYVLIFRPPRPLPEDFSSLDKRYF
jgi:fatty acid desaturase